MQFGVKCMNKYTIKGEKRLKGEICVGGAKNAVLPILAACILCEEEVTLDNCPRLLDVDNTVELLNSLGCIVSRSGDKISVNAGCVSSSELPREFSSKMRSSIFLLGPLIARMKEATAFFPGGCEIGLRPIDLHLKGLAKMNVDILEEHGRIICDGSAIKAADVVLDYPSVGATENLMMAAVLTDGETVIHNAAREPEIIDLQNFLNNLGAKIKGAGGGVITIKGVKKLHGGTYSIMGDRIVAGTFMVAGAITKGDVTVTGFKPVYLQSVIDKLMECGCDVKTYDDAVRIKCTKRIEEIPSIVTAPYPGFPTDMQAQMFALCCAAKGTSLIVENVFENRFKHGAELIKMGANVTIKDKMAIIRGVDNLMGTCVDAMDLRGGAALVLAGLAAKGVTTVNNTYHIHRGYEDFAGKLQSIGGDITED